MGIATTGFPSIKHYSHFRFIDYGSLTVLGVVGACVAWLVVSRISSSPRWFFVRLTIVVTVVLLLPDLWLIEGHQPVRAVLTLMAMHITMALLTYNILVRAAPVRARAYANEEEPESTLAMVSTASVTQVRADTPSARFDAGFGPRTWLAMTVAVGIEFAVGLGELFFVPFSRPNGYLPGEGEAISLVHALVGGFLGIGATAIVLLAKRDDRLARIGSIGGFIGVVIGATGGAICYYQSLRLLGLGLMFVGASVAFFAYLTPLIGN
ncbi:MAG: hypothetical protein HIU57_04585 [Acidobacteria bacterium]|nr:hypothetical protein [Acidobacteriota bacterium]